MTTKHDPYTRSKEHYQDPPQGVLATLKQVGPGMIQVGGVVGSGELIVTNKLGALAGFVFLWFVVFSCLIKVVVQTALARYTICSGKTFLRWDLVEWLKNSPCEEYQWVYSRFRATVKHKENDLNASDGGMAFVLATGDLNGNFNPKLRDFLGTNWQHPKTAKD